MFVNNESITTFTRTISNQLNKQTVQLLPFHQHHIILTYTNLTTPCRILHYWYHNIRTITVTYFTVVCLEDILV